MSIAERQEILNAVSQALNDSNRNQTTSQSSNSTPNEHLWYYKEGSRKDLGTTIHVGMDGKTRTYTGYVDTVFNSVTPSILATEEVWSDSSSIEIGDGSYFRENAVDFTYTYPTLTQHVRTIYSGNEMFMVFISSNITTVFKSGDVISFDFGTGIDNLRIDITVHEKRHHLTCQLTEDSISSSGNIYSVEGVRIGSLTFKDSVFTTSVD